MQVLPAKQREENCTDKGRYLTTNHIPLYLARALFPVESTNSKN